MANPSGIKAGSAYVEITATSAKLQKGLDIAKAKLRSFGNALNAIGKKMMMVSGAMGLSVGFMLRYFAEFDDQMRLARAVTRATSAEFESMTKTAQKLGRETSFTAKQVADGMVSLGRMGFSPQEIEEAIQPTLDLARATGTGLGEAADIAANSMRIFGIESSKMSSVADVLTATANGSAQTLTDLFEALKMAGPQAKAAGENITDTNAALGVLANLGIKGSLAGTALRKSYIQFANVKVQDRLKEFGVSTIDANGNLRKMADTMIDVAKVMQAMPTAKKIAFAEEIFDIRGSLAGLSLAGNIKGLDEFIEKLKNISGTARETAKEMDAGIGGALRQLFSAAEGVVNAIAKAFAMVLTPAIKKTTETLLSMVGWIEENTATVLVLAAAFVTLTTVLSTVGIGLVSAGFAISALASAFTVASGIISVAMAVSSAAVAAFKAVAFGEIYLLIAAVGLLVAAFAFLAYTILDYFGVIEKALNAFGEAFAFVKDWALQSWGAIVNAIKRGDLVAAVNVAWTALKYIWAAGIFKLKEAWYGFKSFFVTTGIEGFYSFMIVANEVYGKILYGWATLVGELKSYWLAFTFVISDAWNSVFASLAKKWVAVKGMFDSSINVKAEQEKIDSEAQASSEKNARGIVDFEAETRAKKDKIKAETQTVTEAYAKEMQDSLNDFTDSQTEALQESQKELDEAWLAWQFAIDEANGTFKAPDAEEEKKKDKKTENPRIANFKLAEQSTQDAITKSFGTFSAKAAMMMGFGGESAATRTAKAAEDTAKNTKETNKLLKEKKGGFAFT